MNLLKSDIIKILILGGGESAERFTHSLMFENKYNLTIAGFDKLNKSKVLAKKYNLEYIYFYNVENFNQYDIIIVSIPSNHKYNILKHIIDKEYTNKFIIEKPFAMTMCECNNIIKLIKNNDFVVPHTRTYLNDIYKFNHKSDILIWNIPNNKNLDIYKENLPHIIQLLIDNSFCCDSVSILEKNKSMMKIRCSNSDITIKFKINNGIYVLNDEHHKINYCIANNNMIAYLLSDEYNKTKEVKNICLNVKAFEKIYYAR